MRRAWLALGLLVLAGGKSEATPSVKAEPAAAVSAPPSAPALSRAAAPAPAQVEKILVPGDLTASVVRSVDGAPPATVFLPGMCSNANAYLQTFPQAARAQGGIVGVDGDQPCGSPTSGYHTFTWDAAKLHARVEAALAAAGMTVIPKEGITLVGYSQGASLAEQMVQRWPDRYARVVLIGAPTNPQPASFRQARGLVTMSCDHDVPARMRSAAESTARAGIPATYFQMPGCRHGNVTDAERIFGASFDWLRTHQRPIDARATAIRISGSTLS